MSRITFKRVTPEAVQHLRRRRRLYRRGQPTTRHPQSRQALLRRSPRRRSTRLGSRLRPLADPRRRPGALGFASLLLTSRAGLRPCAAPSPAGVRVRERRLASGSPMPHRWRAWRRHFAAAPQHRQSFRRASPSAPRSAAAAPLFSRYPLATALLLLFRQADNIHRVPVTLPMIAKVSPMCVLIPGASLRDRAALPSPQAVSALRAGIPRPSVRCAHSALRLAGVLRPPQPPGLPRCEDSARREGVRLSSPTMPIVPRVLGSSTAALSATRPCG